MEDITYCLSRRPDKEWSGLLFWQINEDADLENPESIVINVDQMYLQDLGSTGYTDFDNDGAEIIDLYDKYPKLMDMRCGLIHSHHTMNAFFSGTDQEELHEKAQNGMYFSLIVNNHMKPCAKLCWAVETEIENEIKKHIGRWNFGGRFVSDGKVDTEVVKEKALMYYEIEFDIEFPDSISEIASRYDALDEASIKREASKFNKGGFVGGESLSAGFPWSRSYAQDSPGKQTTLFDWGGESKENDFRESSTWKSIKAHGYEDLAYSSFFMGWKTSKSLEECIAQVVDEINMEVDDEISEKNLPEGINRVPLYKKACRERSVELLEEGDNIISEIAGDIFISYEDYVDFLSDLADKMKQYESIFTNELVNCIGEMLFDEEVEIIDQVKSV
jgi:hypothetical protein